MATSAQPGPAAGRPPTVALLGTLDTKGAEYGFLRERIVAEGVDVLTIDVGILGEPAFQADIGREEVARAGGGDLLALKTRADQGSAVTTMARGATAVVERLHSDGKVDAMLGLGGTSGTALVS